jgi:hypothetical protein
MGIRKSDRMRKTRTFLGEQTKQKGIGMNAISKKKMAVRAFGIIAMIGAIGAAGCSGGQTNKQSSAEASDAQTYIVRGEVVSVQQSGKPGTQLILKHEPIDTFRNAKGQIVGMSTMGMPFTPGKGVSLQGIKPGDKIQMRWVLQWKPEAKEYVESVRKLPMDTQLRFGEAHPPNAGQ